MTLVERTKNILKAKVSQLNDNSLDPVKELEEVLESLRVLKLDLERSAASALAETKLINRQIEVMEGEQAEWLDKAKKAVGAGQDDLARRALSQKKALGREVENCKELLSKTEANFELFREELKNCQEKYHDFSKKLNLLKHNKLMEKAGLSGHKVTNEDEGDLELEFEKIKNKNDFTTEIEDEFQKLKEKLNTSK